MLEHLRQRHASRLVVRPPGQGLGHGVHVGDVAAGVGRDDGIPDAGERGPQPLALLGDGPLALDDLPCRPPRSSPRR
jgi:hypothetical protein